MLFNFEDTEQYLHKLRGLYDINDKMESVLLRDVIDDYIDYFSMLFNAHRNTMYYKVLHPWLNGPEEEKTYKNFINLLIDNEVVFSDSKFDIFFCDKSGFETKKFTHHTESVTINIDINEHNTMNTVITDLFMAYCASAILLDSCCTNDYPLDMDIVLNDFNQKVVDEMSISARKDADMCITLCISNAHIGYLSILAFKRDE